MNVETLADNVWLRLISRAAMLICATAMPVIGILGKRAIDNIDEKFVQLDQLRFELQATNEAMKYVQKSADDRRSILDLQFGGVKDRIDDHEARIRSLERPSNQLR